MHFIFILLIISIIAICFFIYIIYRRKAKTYRNAGKKWDKIVKELSKRK